MSGRRTRQTLTNRAPLRSGDNIIRLCALDGFFVLRQCEARVRGPFSEVRLGREGASVFFERGEDADIFPIHLYDALLGELP